jgi:hypothetical protein
MTRTKPIYTHTSELNLSTRTPLELNLSTRTPLDDVYAIRRHAIFSQLPVRMQSKAEGVLLPMPL